MCAINVFKMRDCHACTALPVFGYGILSSEKRYQNCSDLSVGKKCFLDREKLLKFEAECREFSKVWRSLEQFIQIVKGQNNFW